MCNFLPAFFVVVVVIDVVARRSCLLISINFQPCSWRYWEHSPVNPVITFFTVYSEFFGLSFKFLSCHRHKLFSLPKFINKWKYLKLRSTYISCSFIKIIQNIASKLNQVLLQQAFTVQLNVPLFHKCRAVIGRSERNSIAPCLQDVLLLSLLCVE